MLNDWRIVFTRWDYINRHDTRYKALWTTFPDGTRTAHYYGSYTSSQCMIAAIGRTTAKRLESVGLTPAVVPDRPDVSAMVAGLVAAVAGKGDGK